MTLMGCELTGVLIPVVVSYVQLVHLHDARVCDPLGHCVCTRLQNRT